MCIAVHFKIQVHQAFFLVLVSTEKNKNLGATLEFDLCSPLFFFLSFFMLLARKVLKIAFGKIVSIIVSLHFHGRFTKAQGPDEILIRASWKISTDFTEHQKGLSVFQMKASTLCQGVQQLLLLATIYSASTPLDAPNPQCPYQCALMTKVCS